MKQRELIILSMLRENARQTLTRMSRKSNIPVSTLYDHLKQQEQKLILKHTVLLDFGKLGFSTRAKIALKVRPDDREAVKDFLVAAHCLNSVMKINNGFDFLIEGIFRDMKEMEDFLEQLDQKFKVSAKQIYFIIDDLKKEAFLSNAKLIPLLFPESA